MGSFQGYDFEKKIALRELSLQDLRCVNHDNADANASYPLLFLSKVVDYKEIADRYKHNSEYEFTVQCSDEYPRKYLNDFTRLIENVLLCKYGICSTCSAYMQGEYQIMFNVYYK